MTEIKTEIEGKAYDNVVLKITLKKDNNCKADFLYIF